MQSSMMPTSIWTLPCMERGGALVTSYAAPPVHIYTREDYEHYNLTIRRSEHQCHFSQRPMYDITLAIPNELDIQRLYSVPCGQITNNEPCPSWIYFSVPTESYVFDGECLDTGKWIHDELHSLGWNKICEPTQERFVCPTCSNHMEVTRGSDTCQCFCEVTHGRE